VPLVLHGTHPLSDDMVRISMGKGMRKINQNRNVRNRYMKYLEGNSGKEELTVLQTRGVEIYSEEIERVMVEVFDSAGKA
jgi:fructose-bisphosphate aldolase class II